MVRFGLVSDNLGFSDDFDFGGGVASLEPDFHVVPFGLGVGFSFLMTTCGLGVDPVILEVTFLKISRHPRTWILSKRPLSNDPF